VKVFENKTNLGKEPAVKKGHVLPTDAVNLGWFSGQDVNPENNLSVTDLSHLIPENTSPVLSSETDSIMYSDEFGTLRYAVNNPQANQYLGSPIVNNPEVCVSNLIISPLPEGVTNLTAEQYSSALFAHSFYISTHYVLLPSNAAAYSGMSDTPELREPSRYNIKVVDSSANNFVDESGKNKYRILIDKYVNTRTNADLQNSQYQGLDFYRVVVLLEVADPIDLYLIYDKYEKDAENIPYNPFFGYKEKINTLPYYQYVVEESEVIDPGSIERKVYSTQLFSFKENVLLKRKENNYGWKIYVPRKAIQDPRTFQNFNWRIIAKITYNFAQVRNVYSEAADDRATLNVGVLYSGEESAAKNAYVFYNLQESVFNLQNFIFENPRASITDKSQKNYWLVNIDDTNVDYSSYDFLIWTPLKPITPDQGQQIAAIQDKNISVFVDGSEIAANPSAGFSNLNIDMSISSSSSGSIGINDTYQNADTSFNAWSLSEYHEGEVPMHSIFGKRKNILDNNALLPIITFTGTPNSDSASKALVTVGSNTAILKTTKNSQVLFSSSLITCVNPFLQLLNDKILGDGTQTSNNGSSNIFPVGKIGSQNVAVTAAVVGPNKLFYNILCGVNKNKVNSFATNNTSSKSNVLWNVSPWRSSWTINGKVTNGKVTVLSDQEKQEYNFSSKSEIGNSTSKFCRQISPSLSSTMLGDFEATTNGGDAQNIINSDFSNVEFYLECTNKNVEFLNFSKDFDNTEIVSNQPSAKYVFYKLNTPASNQITNKSEVSIDAVSNVFSAEFNFNTVRYPYIIVGSSQYEDRTGSTIRTPTDFLPGSQNTKDYSFSFKTKISINEIRKTINTYRINWSAPFSAEVGTTARFSNITFVQERNGVSLERGFYSNTKAAENKTKIKKSFSPFNGYNYPGIIYSRTDIAAVDQDSVNDSFNTFHYTGDIDEGNRWDEYRLGYSEKIILQDSNGKTLSVNQPNDKYPYVVTTKTRGGIRGREVAKSDIQSAITNARTQNNWEDLLEGEELEHYLWSTEVINGSKIHYFRSLFKDWLINTYIKSKRNNLGLALQNIGFSDIEILQSFSNSEVDAQFNLAYPNLFHVRTEEQTFQIPGRSLTPATSNSTVSGANYTKYIQYTLQQIFKKETINIDGVYGLKTYNLVKRFQQLKSQSFIDGIVDSETKSVLAHFWLKLHRDNFARFEKLRNDAPAGTKRFINAAVKYSDISSILEGREYRRISFTGIKGPTTIVDYIMVRIPQREANQTIHSVKIKSGEWPLVIDNVHLYDEDFNIKRIYGSGSPEFAGRIYSPQALDQDVRVPANSERIVSFVNGRPGAKWLGIKVKGVKLKADRYGPNAEGFSISGIDFELTAQGPTISAVKGEDARFTGIIEGTISGYTDIKSDEEATVVFSTFAELQKTPNANISQINVNKLNFTVVQEREGVKISKDISYSVSPTDRTNILNQGISFTYDDILGDNDLPIQTDALSSGTSFNVGTITKGVCQRLSGTSAATTVSSSDFSITSYKTNAYIVKTTNGVDYESIEASPETVVSDYYLADADNISSRQNSIQTVNIKDGLTVLVDSIGRAVGFPNFDSYKPTGTNNVVSFGFLNLIWNETSAAPYGLDWGFLYIPNNSQIDKRKKLLGRKISYLEWLEYEGTGDVYIAVNAFDADNDASSTNNIVGFQERYGAISESNAPARYICPVYSVKVKNRSKIRVSSPPKDLSKFDTWFVNVGVGRFIKKITIPIDYNFLVGNWMREYKGKELICHYDTTKIQVPYSSIFGTGHYDIHEENPVIVSDDTITLRHRSFIVAQEQYDKKLVDKGNYTDASPIVPWVFISIKNEQGNWISVSRKQIRDYDKNTGRITFVKEIVPTSDKNIKVTYTVKNSDLMLHQIDGEIIPLNPYLFIEQNKPIFLYILPIKCEEIVDGENKSATGFVSTGAVKFTYDSNIFNNKSTVYNPLALHIATINVNNTYDFDNMQFQDMRVRGGGIKHNVAVKSSFESNAEVASYADIYTGHGYVHANGGYVVIQIPRKVMENFNSKQQVYDIVRNNLTAGVSFDIQDVDGTDWRSINYA